jgi:hypothetical protein
MEVAKGVSEPDQIIGLMAGASFGLPSSEERLNADDQASALSPLDGSWMN